MLTFYPEFEAEIPREVEVLFLLDLSCSMKVSHIMMMMNILYREPKTRSKKLLYSSYVTAFLRTGLFLDTFKGTFSRENRISYERIRTIRYQKGTLNVIKRQKIPFLGL